MTVKPYRIAMVALPVVLMLGIMVWLFCFTVDESDAQTTLNSAVAAIPENETSPPSQTTSASTALEPLGHLRISRQFFARGGLGSKALVTFTLRNDNPYAVKDPEILCAFRSKDGSYSTERRRTISDTVNMKSRKTYPYTFIGFVNVKASQAKCSLVTASRI